MPALFTSPRFVALSATNQLLPGAKLTFSVSGTSTLQNVYQDEALTVPHSNPVTADGAGVFAKIYLDPSLPNYRVLLTDSALVTQPGYPLDDIPSNQNVAQALRLKSAAPELIFEETDASAGNKKWSLRANAEQMTIALLNDAESVRTDIVRIDRSGSVVDSINFLATDVLTNSLQLPGSLAVRKPTFTNRSNTATLTDDPHLSLSVPVAGVYAIDISLIVYGDTGGSGGFQYRLEPVNGTSSAIGAGGVQRINSVDAIGSFGSSLSSTAFGIPVTVAQIIRREFALLTPTGAMTLNLQWAQEVSDADVTRLDFGSLLSITRISS